MSCEQKREITLFLSVLIVCLYAFQVCHSVSLGQWWEDLNTYQGQESAAPRWAQVQRDEHLVEQVIQATDLRTTSQPGLQEIWPESAALPGEIIAPTLDETGSNFATNGSSWSAGKIRRQRRTSAPDSQDVHQAHLTGKRYSKGQLHQVLGYTSALTWTSRGKTTKASHCRCLQCCSLSFRSPWSPGEGFGSII